MHGPPADPPLQPATRGSTNPAFSCTVSILQDRALTSPGELEQQQPHPRLYTVYGELKKLRDANLRLPWDKVAGLLAEAASLLGTPGPAGSRCAVPAT